MSRCRSCGAAIEWSRTVNGKSMPLDAEPTDDGNVVVRDRVAHVLGPMELLMVDEDEVLRMPHHATCPDAGAWRPRS